VLTAGCACTDAAPALGHGGGLHHEEENGEEEERTRVLGVEELLALLERRAAAAAAAGVTVRSLAVRPFPQPCPQSAGSAVLAEGAGASCAA
jgi:hypothetical protein